MLKSVGIRNMNIITIIIKPNAKILTTILVFS